MNVNLLWLTWPIFGVVAGLFVANYAYATHPSEGSVIAGSRDHDAAASFGLAVVFFPLILVVSICWLILQVSKWLVPRTVAQLLPAYRREQRQKLIQTEQENIAKLRKEINDMHKKIGIPPVDWSGKTENKGE